MQKCLALLVLICTIASHVGAQIAGRAVLRVKLFTASNSLADGCTVIFDDSFSDEVDRFDAIKLFNPGENIAMRRNGVLLSVETKKATTQADTIHLQFKNLLPKTYRLHVLGQNMPEGYEYCLTDQFAKAEKIVQAKDSFSFYVDFTADPASFSADRLKIILRKKQALAPFAFTAVHAVQNLDGVHVDFKVTNQNAIQYYELQCSRDGLHFQRIYTLFPAANVALYNYSDEVVRNGTMVYRVMAADASGTLYYSLPAKVNIMDISRNIFIAGMGSANPALIFKNIPGSYRLTIRETSSSVMEAKSFAISTFYEVVNLNVNRLQKGRLYFAEITTGNHIHVTTLQFIF